MWIQHHNGIFRSDDGGSLWQEVLDVKPSSFGFAVAVHPKDGDTAWFVPEIKDEKRIPDGGKLVVTRTRDGGKTFDILRNGLPQKHAYDIIYRHGLDVSASGNDLVVRLDHRRSVGFGRPRRQLDNGRRPLAAGLRRAVHGGVISTSPSPRRPR